MFALFHARYRTMHTTSSQNHSEILRSQFYNGSQSTRTKKVVSAVYVERVNQYLSRVYACRSANEAEREKERMKKKNWISLPSEIGDGFYRLSFRSELTSICNSSARQCDLSSFFSFYRTIVSLFEITTQIKVYLVGKS